MRLALGVGMSSLLRIPLVPVSLATALLSGCTATLIPLLPKAPPDFVYVLPVAAFQDSDGDGVGDLLGVRWHIQHIRSLGVQTVQLTPVAPGWDAGRTIPVAGGLDPALGSLDELAALAGDLHAEGMRLEVQVPMDAIGRSHPWFREGLLGGGRIELGLASAPGWCPTGDARYYYASQGCGSADLDWDDPGLPGDVVAGLAPLVDAGVDGFVLRDFQTEGDRPPLEAASAVVAEALVADPALGLVTAPNDPVVQTLQPWVGLGPVADVPRTLAWDAASRDADVGWVTSVLTAWGDDVSRTRPFLSDYDRSRLASRVHDATLRRTLLTLHLLGPGHPALYYGDELDLPDTTTQPVDMPWRAPMPWNGKWNCGFSTGEPWFEADPACKVGVDAYDEARTAGSMLLLVRWLGEVRSMWGATTATLVPTGSAQLLAFRSGELLVVGNVGTGERRLEMPGLVGVDLATGGPVGATIVVGGSGARVVHVLADGDS